MPFHTEDLEALQNATGLSDMELFARPDLEHEYGQRVAMFHAMGGQGPLPPLALIDMLRFLNYAPPVRSAPEPERPHWREVRRNSKVLITTEHGVYAGEYAGYTGDGIFVCFGEDPEQHEFAPAQVTLAPRILPPGVKTKWETPGVATSPFDLKIAQERSAVAEAQVADLAEVPPPVPVSKDDQTTGRFTDLSADVMLGDPVECKMGRGKKRKTGKYVSQGPKEGTLYVVLDGEMEPTVFETDQVIVLEQAE